MHRLQYESHTQVLMSVELKHVAQSSGNGSGFSARLRQTVGWTTPSSSHSAGCNQIQLCSCRNGACMCWTALKDSVCCCIQTEEPLLKPKLPASSHSAILHGRWEFQANKFQAWVKRPVNTGWYEYVPLALYAIVSWAGLAYQSYVQAWLSSTVTT